MFTRYKTWRASLESEQVLSLTAYVLGILWGVSIIVFPSRGITQLLQIPYGFTYFWAISAIVGGVIAIRGAVRRDNLVVELLGLQILSLGPLVYGLAMMVLVVIQIMTGAQVTVASVGILGLICFVLYRKRAARLKLRVDELKKDEEEE